MADFDTWKFTSLVQFAKDAQEKINALETEIAEMIKDKQDLIAVLRRVFREETHDPGS